MKRFNLVIVCLACTFFGCSQPAEKPVVDPSVATGSVTMEIVYPGTELMTIEVAGIAPGQTLLEAIQTVENPKFKTSGAGQGAFITAIGDWDTSGSEGWSYYVNDQWADRSAGVYEINPGDVIRWKYGSFEPE
jgi:hypothetical protein